jgi:hypothetical protein
MSLLQDSVQARTESRRRTLLQDIVAANVEAIVMPPRSKREVLAASPRGRTVTLPDGTPALFTDVGLLGAVANADVFRHAFDAAKGQKTLCVVFGMGVGYAVRELRARTQGNVLVYEPDPSLLRTLLEDGPTDLGGIYVTTDLQELEAMWPALTDTPSATLFMSQGYGAAFPNELTALRASIQKLICDTEIIENTRSARFCEWIGHMAENLHVLSSTSPVTALSGALEGVPAFIVGAGPSLDKNVKALADAKKKGIVIAVDVAGSALDRNGVVPHMLVSLEALNLSKHIANLSYVKDVILSPSLTGHPDCFKIDAGHVMPFFEALGPFSAVVKLADVPGVIVGGSVSTVAFSLATLFGCSPIVLVGQDLGYTGASTHASGTAFDGCTMERNADNTHVAFSYNETIKQVRAESSLGAAPAKDPLFEVPAWGGEGQVISTASFNAFRLWFEIWATSMNGHVELVNATEGGSRIEGFREATLADVLAELPDTEISAEELAAKARAKRPALSPRTVARFFDSQIAATAKVERRANELTRVAREAQAAIESENPSEVVRAFNALTTAEEAVRAASSEAPMLSGWLYAETAKLKASMPDTTGMDMQKEATQGVAASIELGRVIAKGARALQKELERGKKNVKNVSPKNPRQQSRKSSCL